MQELIKYTVNSLLYRTHTSHIQLIVIFRFLMRIAIILKKRFQFSWESFLLCPVQYGWVYWAVVPFISNVTIAILYCVTYKISSYSIHVAVHSPFCYILNCQYVRYITYFYTSTETYFMMHCNTLSQTVRIRQWFLFDSYSGFAFRNSSDDLETIHCILTILTLLCGVKRTGINVLVKLGKTVNY